MIDARILRQEYLVNTYPFRGKTFVRGNGSYLYDENGQKYLDLMTNYGVNIFGYNNLQITKALKDQLTKLPSLHCSFTNDVRAEAAKLLVKRCAGKLSKVYFSSSGSEAVEAALKFALVTSNKNEIISFGGAFHGKTFASLSVTPNRKYREGLEKLLWKTKFVKYGDGKALSNAVSKKTAAVIIEPIQGESGIVLPPDGFLKSVENVCKENGVILILDEIQTGVGKTGTFLASQKENVEPDMVCLGKGLAGGIPVGATLVSNRIAAKIPKLSQTSTFGGNPLACRGILEVLNLLDDDFLINIKSLGSCFIRKLRSIKSTRIREVRGSGLMIGVEVSGDRNEVLKSLQQNNILAAPAGDDVVRFLPPYIISKRDIDLAVSTLKKVMS